MSEKTYKVQLVRFQVLTRNIVAENKREAELAVRDSASESTEWKTLSTDTRAVEKVKDGN